MKMDYPDRRKKFNYFLYRLIMKYSLIIAVIICFIVNISIGKGYWSLIVAIAVRLYYSSFVSNSLIEKSYEQKLLNIIYGIAVLFAIIDIFRKTTLLNNVFPIILFSVMILQILIFIKDIRYQNINVLPLIYSFILGIVIYFLIIFDQLTLNWPIIVVWSLTGAFPVLSLIFGRKTFIKEIKKRFSTK